MGLKSLWGNLKFNTGSAVTSAVSRGAVFTFGGGSDSQLVYKNPRYKSVLVYMAKRLAVQALSAELNSILPNYIKKQEAKRYAKIREQQKDNLATLILNQNTQSENWGVITAEGGHQIIARDKYGTKVKEALMLYYDDDESHQVNSVKEKKQKVNNSVEDIKVGYEEDNFSTKTLCHIDLAPQVSISSSKNLVMTQVQGRDYSRKELVSGGDVQFSISGNIVSNERGVYPMDAVKKFVKIMEYNGILNVNFLMFEPFGINKVIVKGYSLGNPEFKNIQPYSFECVAVEPDDEIKITADTISVINKALEASPADKWYNLILGKQLSKAITTGIVNSATSAATSGAALGLDEITTNI